MKHTVSASRKLRTVILACSALGGLAVSAATSAQETAEDESGIRDIVVTAQKREQSMQDVPVAVTALDQTALQVNRVVSVMDLSALAPNLNVINTGGGAGIPSFGVRGVLSAGNVAGQDKSLGIYLDGVYIGSSSGVAFDLPAVERIEVLRGPQGTLFGRNSTAGAISVVTMEPKGELGVKVQGTVGNYNQLRTAATVHTPSWGPFSAMVSYVHEERDGDIKNTGAGQTWILPTASGLGTLKSPKTLGAKNAESIFGSVKFEPSDGFKVVYRFDRLTNHYTPPGVGIVAWTGRSRVGNAGDATMNAAFNAAIAAGRLAISGTDRPDEVNNFFTMPSYQKTTGHNLTITADLTDNITVKNVLAYRKSFLYSLQQYSGAGGFFNGVNPYSLGDITLYNDHKQWSDEFQLNYESDHLTLTAGGIWYSMKALEGPVPGMNRVSNRLTVPGGNFNNVIANKELNDNKAHALAGFVQGEFHVTPQLDLVGGLRVTQDVKKGINTVNGVAQAPFNYNDTRSSWLGGVNFRPNDDILLYAKYSTGFVAGGKVAIIEFAPETVKSWEAGIKADLFDRLLRINLALFDSKYKNLQNVTIGTRLVPSCPPGVNDPAINTTICGLGTVIVTQGDMHAKGIEAEVTIAPTRGLTLNGSFGYTDYKLSNLNPLFCPAPTCTSYKLNYRPKATGNLGAQYESDPLFGDAHLMLRVDGNWRSKVREISRLPVNAGQGAAEFSPAGWVVNGRLALRDVSLGFGKLEVAGWVRNLFDNDRPEFVNSVTDYAATSYEPARTFGLDVTFQY